uniref:Ig-like domain-containing protein n=1 Tax=Lates calcarifer TaxID=8187 RepID=A0A4W6CW79_LATCA
MTQQYRQNNGQTSMGLRSQYIFRKTINTGVVSASVGDNVTLRCFYDSQVAMHFSWYRQTLGGRPELMSTIYKYDQPSKVFHWLEKNPRFSVHREQGMNHLHIADIHLSDSATYFCGSSHSNMLEFGEGVFLSVEESRLQEIIQGPASETIQPGGSVTFNCTVNTGTCDRERSVYWFRHGSRHGIIHTHGDQCTRVSTPGVPSQGCVYHLQRTNLSASDGGTYYCAVASCGEILFGNGSKLLITDDEDQKLRILVWLSIIRAGILFFFLKHRIKKINPTAEAVRIPQFC